MQMRRTRKTSLSEGFAGLQLSVRSRTVVPWLLGLSLIIVSACTPNQRIIESSRTPEPAASAPTPKANTVESDLKAMQDADFTFILLFRRKDGAVMAAEDKAFINAALPPDVNRKTLSDGGKAVMIGSNFPLQTGTVEQLTDRFVMEDHSKPDAGPLEVDRTGNTNANADKGRKGAANSDPSRPPKAK